MPLLDGVSLSGLLLATLLPWLAGTALLRLLLPKSPWTLSLGHGYLLGQLLVVLLLLAWNRAGLDLAWWPLAGLLALLTLVLGAPSLWRAPARPRLPSLGWRDALWLLPLLLFLGLRGSLMAEELALRPLFPWDAWMNWAPRAVVWFEHAQLTAFSSPEAWLQATPGEELYTLGNRPAGNYPPGIPLLLLWHMLGTGSADHTLVYLPWLLLGPATALALWGHLRAAGAGRVLAALAVYALLSMPLPASHMMLAGYADLWLGVAFTLGVLALAQLQASGRAGYALLAVAMALFCGLLKNPGLGFAALLLGGLVLVYWRPPLRWLLAPTLAGLALLLVGLLAGLNPDWVAAMDARPALDLPGNLPDLKLRLSPLLPYLGETFFVGANWHLLGVLVVAALGAGLLLPGRNSLCDIALFLLVAGTALLVFVFGFTQYAGNVSVGVTFHRAFLYVVPLAVYVAFARLAPLLRKQGAAGC